MPKPTHDLTELLSRASRGDRSAWDELMPLVYDELKRLANDHMRRERASVTIQPTVLVHEAFLRLVTQERSQWTSRAHFLGAAAEAMRRVLVDAARARHAAKRGPAAGRVSLSEGPAAALAVDFENGATDILALDDALGRLAQIAPQQSRIVELRFFGGLSVEQTAEVLNISPSSVDRGWRIARAWLLREITRG